MHHPPLFAKRAEKQDSLNWLTPYSRVARFFPKLMDKTLMKMAILAHFIKVQRFAYVKKLVVEKYAKFVKYAKPKIFMPTISKNCQNLTIWHKNMPVGNTALQHLTIVNYE